ncbi:hypothetical protein NQ317_014584 [Molorchus minor]|uniref:Uncharacterized protein n=1 Tax=Molorchus minor TaxID=1323400 RepID=A0ABQ9ISM3_9CUCU|nr:hypothetical protein NQ317_014584 [Molorchus minor]
MAPRFSATEDEKLIEEVRKYSRSVFKSIALKVKKMKLHLITKTQLKVLMVVSEIEAEAQIFTTQAGHNSTQTNPESFTCQANTYSFSPQGKPSIISNSSKHVLIFTSKKFISNSSKHLRLPPQGTPFNHFQLKQTLTHPSQGNPQSFNYTSNQSFSNSIKYTIIQYHMD